jgi:hypothetical protein
MHPIRSASQPHCGLAARGATSPLIVLLLSACLLAGAPLPAYADDDLPGRVGRIAEFAGQLYLSPEDRATEWQAVGLNYPVSSGDNLWVGGEGRAEIDYGGGQFRFAGDTNLHVSRLDENQIALFVAQGRVILRVRVLDPGDSARIDTPNTQIQLTRPGLYRVDVATDRQVTTIVVREGEAIVGLASGAQQALPGQTVTVAGPDPAMADVRSGIGQDEFDAWSANRDRRYERGRSTAYVSRQMVGYADLDENGTWQTTPEYGAVWYPSSVAADWAPYSDGYWTNVGGYGPTWVDAAPWGYAPFHYGRWMRVGSRWGWCPGTYVARPIWAPALVGWYGGAGWGMSASLGRPVYGWVPLGWGEASHPWWRCSNNCWASHNRPYAVNVTVRPNNPPQHYRNIGVPGAVTAVAGTTLTGHLPVAANRIAVPTNQISTAPVLAAAPAVAAGPLRIPGARPGMAGTPPPASTFYPVTRPSRAGAEPLVRPPVAAGSAPVRTKPASVPEGVPGRATTATPAISSTPAPTPARGDASLRSRPQPAQPSGVPLPPTVTPQPSTPPTASAGAVTPPPRTDDMRRQRQTPPTVSGVPAVTSPQSPVPQPIARPAPTRPPTSERIGTMPPLQAPHAVQGAPVAAPVAMPHAPPPVATGANPQGAHVEHGGPAKPVVPKGETAPGPVPQQK